MVKSIQLKLLKIKYSGDSIGDDIRTEIEILGKFLHIDRTIKVGITDNINEEIGNFETDRELFEANLRITIIEKDALFNDIGSTEGKIKINTNTAKLQQFVYDVQIREIRSALGKPWGKRKAAFEVTLEATVSDATLYVSFEQSKNGWIQVVKEDDKTKIDLPAYLKVKLDRQDSKRQYFTIMEGSWRQRKASVKIKENGTSYLESINYQTGPAHLVYSWSRRILKFKNKVYKVRAYENDQQPWRNTLYDIKIPDFYHGKGRPYLDRAKLAPVWFKTTHPSDDRYVHVGVNSLGCITLTEVERWDELCEILMKARRGDGESIGILEVID